MKQYRVESSTEIAAPPAAVYAVLADYHQGHPGILPKGQTLTVESGGTGAGTVFVLTAKVMGIRGRLRMAVTEPEPGRVLMESGTEPGGPVTTFTVEPLRGGAASRLTISTLSTRRGGVIGRIERRFMERLMRRMVAEEFRKLASRLEPAGRA